MTRLLWDASPLAKRFVKEDSSEIVNALFEISDGAHSVTYLGFAEIAAVLRRRRNANRMSQRAFEDARIRLRDTVLLSPRFDLVTVENADILAGMALTDRHNINTSDAAILAAFLGLTKESGDRVILVVSDHRLARAARAEGFATLDPARVSPSDLLEFGLG